MTAPVFIDTNVPMYAAGRPHPCREAARDTIRGIVSGHIDAVTDSEVLQEILYRYFAIGEKATGLAVFDSFAAIMKDRVLPVTEADVMLARQFAGSSNNNLSPRDLIHLAVMKSHSITRIITADAAFDTVEWVQRSDLRAVAK
ncbi:MAG TPA: type II toxin-antitoxin system VapC family toxin [Firmicutes bacterium]|nr:type II toxin-antitoxin system VapC family toxin [Bacillota bacterium]